MLPSSWAPPAFPGSDRTLGGSRSTLFKDSLRCSQVTLSSHHHLNLVRALEMKSLRPSLMHCIFFFLSHFALGLEEWLGDLLSECRVFSFASMGIQALKTHS